MTFRGKEQPYGMKLTLAFVGEMIKPVQGPNSYEEFLNERGEGLHHPGYFESEDALGCIVEAIEMPQTMPDPERTFPE